MIYNILFFTHTGAIKFEREMKKRGISCELMPVPRELSSNCSISARIDYQKDALELVDKNIEKIFKLEKGEHILIYSEDNI
jgi:hypothetical protein